MFNFTLAESPRGLRITRGLTNLTSQSVPINRIQGVKVSQPLLWKPLGWYRVDVDVVGYGAVRRRGQRDQATSVLLPVATRDEVDLALEPGPAGLRPGRHRAAPRRRAGPAGCAGSTSGPCATAGTTGP